MTPLTSPPVSELAVMQTTCALLAEWLRAWFDGAQHAVGQNPPVLFPIANIAFGQSDPVQPLARFPADVDTEIRVVTFTRHEEQASMDTTTSAGKLISTFQFFNFWVSAKHPGPAQSALAAQTVGDLLKAILTNPDTRYPLAAKGITTLRPTPPQVIPSTDYHKRLVACSATLQYTVGGG